LRTALVPIVDAITSPSLVDSFSFTLLFEKAEQIAFSLGAELKRLGYLTSSGRQDETPPVYDQIILAMCELPPVLKKMTHADEAVSTIHETELCTSKASIEFEATPPNDWYVIWCCPREPISRQGRAFGRSRSF